MMGKCEYCNDKPATHKVIDDRTDYGVAMICDDCYRQMEIEYEDDNVIEEGKQQMIINNQYPTRQEMKDAHQAADDLHIDYDSHTLRSSVVEFMKDKILVARYDIVTGWILSGQSFVIVDDATPIDKKV